MNKTQRGRLEKTGLTKFKISGINIQFPWADRLLNREKIIETRKYPLPIKHESRYLWIIETPGKLGKFKARVVGIISFRGCKRYLSLDEWNKDAPKHLCGKGSGYEWDGTGDKYGWLISYITRIKEPFSATSMSRGIIYSSPFEAEVERIIVRWWEQPIKPRTCASFPG